MNGTKLLEYELGRSEWKTMVRRSKFKRFATCGKLGKGHVVLQDHGGPVWYRNIKICKIYLDPEWNFSTCTFNQDSHSVERDGNMVADLPTWCQKY